MARSYNSTFFVSLTNNSYDIYFASHGFENGESFAEDTPEINVYPSKFTSPSIVQAQAQKLGSQEHGSVFERLENADCIQAYAKSPLSDRRTLVLVSSLPHDNLQNIPGIWSGDLFNRLENSSLYNIIHYHSTLFPERLPLRSNKFSWICSQHSQYNISAWKHEHQSLHPLCGDGYWQAMKSNASLWTVYGFKIDYCLSERLEDGCKLNMAGDLLIIVIVFNAMVYRP